MRWLSSRARSQAATTALIYFAGHGFAVDGTYYLLPVDLPAAGPGEEVLVRDASFAANGLSDRLQEKGAATAILILDACRGNPLPQPGKRSIGLTRGLTRMDPPPKACSCCFRLGKVSRRSIARAMPTPTQISCSPARY